MGVGCPVRWKVGRKVEVLGIWKIASRTGIVELTAGSPYYQVTIIDQSTGMRLYDQGSGTFASTPHNFPLPPHTAGVGFRTYYTFPAATSSREVTITAIHPSHPIPIIDSGWVTDFDLNDIDLALQSGGLIPGDVEQENFQPVP